MVKLIHRILLVITILYYMTIVSTGVIPSIVLFVLLFIIGHMTKNLQKYSAVLLVAVNTIYFVFITAQIYLNYQNDWFGQILLVTIPIMYPLSVIGFIKIHYVSNKYSFTK